MSFIFLLFNLNSLKLNYLKYIHDIISLHMVHIFLLFFFYHVIFFNNIIKLSSFTFLQEFFVVVVFPPHAFKKRLRKSSRQCANGVLFLLIFFNMLTLKLSKLLLLEKMERCLFNPYFNYLDFILYLF